jgi:hypothetical protein
MSEVAFYNPRVKVWNRSFPPRPHKEPTLPTPWSLTPGLQNWETIRSCCVTQLTIVTILAKYYTMSSPMAEAGLYDLWCVHLGTYVTTGIIYAPFFFPLVSFFFHLTFFTVDIFTAYLKSFLGLVMI